MGIMKFFDYVWFRVFTYYTSKADDTAKISASFTLSLGQAANLLTFLFPLDYLLENGVLNKPVVIIIALAILFFNVIRYKKERLVIMSEIWDSDSVSERKKKGFIDNIFDFQRIDNDSDSRLLWQFAQ